MFLTKESLSSPYNWREKNGLQRKYRKSVAPTYSGIEQLLSEDIFNRGNPGQVPYHTLKMINSILTLFACSRSSWNGGMPRWGDLNSSVFLPDSVTVSFCHPANCMVALSYCSYLHKNGIMANHIFHLCSNPGHKHLEPRDIFHHLLDKTHSTKSFPWVWCFLALEWNRLYAHHFPVVPFLHLVLKQVLYKKDFSKSALKYFQSFTTANRF